MAYDTHSTQDTANLETLPWTQKMQEEAFEEREVENFATQPRDNQHVVVVVAVFLASGWRWVSIPTPALGCKTRRAPPKVSLQRESFWGGPEESLCWSTVHTTCSQEPTLHIHQPDVGDTVIQVICMC